MVDHDPPGGGKPISVFESGAMLVYLAEKTGQFLPNDPAPRADVMQWLFWQMGGLGPMSGQNNHFQQLRDDKIPYAMDRYRNEVNRLYGVMDRRLGRSFVPGRRIFHRRHGELSVGGAARAAAPEDRRLSKLEKMARRHRGAAGDGARLRHCEEGQSEPRRHPHRRGARHPVRPDRGVDCKGSGHPRANICSARVAEIASSRSALLAKTICCHCEPTGPALGRPDDRLREATSRHRQACRL